MVFTVLRLFLNQIMIMIFSIVRLFFNQIKFRLFHIKQTKDIKKFKKKEKYRGQNFCEKINFKRINNYWMRIASLALQKYLVEICYCYCHVASQLLSIERRGAASVPFWNKLTMVSKLHLIIFIFGFFPTKNKQTPPCQFLSGFNERCAMC